MRTLEELTRPNIWQLAPYSSARNEYSGHVAHVFLDANENPYNQPFNRYPDPLQQELKDRISKVKGIPAECIFLGNGSDEAIDLPYRCFTRPGIDNVVAIEPTYGMYKVCADINDVEYRRVLMDENFQPSADKILAAVDANTKLIFFCSPNNPSANNIDRKVIDKVLDVLNTLSKAWGCAAIRLGMAFASKEIIGLYNKVKYPYNVNLLTQQQAMEVLKDPFEVDKWVKLLLQERTRMMQAFKELPTCQKVYPTDANFFLAKVNDAQKTYDYLVNKGIIVRNRSRVALCQNCLRITIGNKSENNELLSALRQF